MLWFCGEPRLSPVVFVRPDMDHLSDPALTAPTMTKTTIAKKKWPFVLACEMDERLKGGDMMT